MDSYTTGTLAGAGSFRCEECGFHVVLLVPDLVPECPHCGEAEFTRASMFDVAEPDTSDLHDDETGWLDTVRDGIEGMGQYIVFRDDDRVCVVAVSKEWTRVGRSIAADIRLDDPTVSRRHALMCRQGGSVRVLDDRSLNGLFLNGVRIEWHDLQDGDELVVGRYSLHYMDTSVGSRPSAVGATA